MRATIFIELALTSALLSMGCKSAGAPGAPTAPADAAHPAPIDPRPDATSSEAAEPVDGAGEGADSADDPGVGADVSPTRQLCEAGCRTTESVPCAYHVPGCAELCEGLLAGDACRVEEEAVITCRVAIGPAAYACPAGTVEPIAGICQSEVDAYQACRSRDSGM